jgi:hypothetical protein
VLRLIVQFLDVEDLISLACCNSWFYKQVKEVFNAHICGICGVWHSGEYLLHPGRYNGVSFHQVKTQHRLARFQKAKDVAVDNAELVTAAAVVTVVAGALIVGAPLAVGAGILNVGMSLARGVHGNKRNFPQNYKLNSWDCCGLTELEDPPCHVCDRKGLTSLMENEN